MDWISRPWGLCGWEASLTCEHCTPPTQDRRVGPDFLVQLSFTGMKCQEIQADTSTAPSSIQMQPVCVLNTGTSSHLGAFTHAVPSAWKASLSSSRFKGHFLPEASPDCSLISRLSASPSEHLPCLSSAHLSKSCQWLQAWSGWGTLSVLAQQVVSQAHGDVSSTES